MRLEDDVRIERELKDFRDTNRTEEESWDPLKRRAMDLSWGCLRSRKAITSGAALRLASSPV